MGLHFKDPPRLSLHALVTSSWKKERRRRVKIDKPLLPAETDFLLVGGPPNQYCFCTALLRIAIPPPSTYIQTIVYIPPPAPSPAWSTGLSFPS